MLIQYVLILGVLLLLAFFLRNHGTIRTSAGVKVGFLLFLLFGIVAVLRPDDVSTVARYVGVGRGTDLLLYGLVVAFAFAALNTHLHFKELESRYARLVRTVVLREATHAPPQSSTPGEEGSASPEQ